MRLFVLALRKQQAGQTAPAILVCSATWFSRASKLVPVTVKAFPNLSIR